MPGEHVLVVEDEEDIREIIRHHLAREGYQVTCAADGAAALAAVAASPPDAIVLDLMLAGTDGLQVCRHIKGDPRTARITVIIVTAKCEEADVVTGLEMGADDYLTKPFSPRILVARIRAVLRRKKEEHLDDKAVVCVSNLVITPGRHEVLLRGRPVSLTATEFRYLHLLARHQGIVFTREKIIDAVKGTAYLATDRSVDVQIANMRRKLGADGDCIETVRGVGYRFQE